MKKYQGLLQIGEVAKLYGISRKMILNYEKLGLIKPVLTDAFTGYRYYDFVAISRIGLILDLRRTDMHLSDIGAYLNGQITVENQINKLQEQIKSIQYSIEQLKIRDVHKNCLSPITVSIIPSANCLIKDCVADTVENGKNMFVQFYSECFKKEYFSKNSLLFTEFKKDVFAEDFYETENIKMSFAISVNPEVCKENTIFFPETPAVSVTFCGALEKSKSAYEIIKNYICEHGLKTKGYPREYYLEGETKVGYEKNLIRIVVPIMK